MLWRRRDSGAKKLVRIGPPREASRIIALFAGRKACEGLGGVGSTHELGGDGRMDEIGRKSVALPAHGGGM